MAAADQTPLGTGLGRTTEPQEVLAGVDLTGKQAIVTGGYSGIGLETVRALAAVGASITVPARSPDKAKANLSDVAGDVTIAPMDLADIDSVRRFAADYAASHDRLDLLINNAGIMACPLRRVGPGWESQFGTNHLGHFALTTALMPLLEKAEAPRVVALSSIAHRRNGILWDDPNFDQGEYQKWVAYAQAKSANALFALGLGKRMAAFGGRAFSVHPGGIFTPLQRDLDLEEQVELGWLNPDGTPSEMAQKFFKTPTQGCSTTLWAATSPALEALNGVYCEDCDVAPLQADRAARYGAMPHICDEDDAERLWAMSEELLGQV